MWMRTVNEYNLKNIFITNFSHHIKLSPNMGVSKKTKTINDQHSVFYVNIYSYNFGW